jgi:hypothetical protein
MSTSSFAQEQAGVPSFDLAGITNTVGCLIAICPTGEQKANMLPFCTWFFERAQLR